MSKKQPKIIILFGRSGSGKGTQAKLLQKEFPFDYSSSGNLLRARAKKNDFSGKKLRKVLNKGELAPTFLMVQAWSKKIREIKKEKNLRGLIIDGSPRALLEAKLMDDAFNWYEWSNVKIILLDISHKEAFNRLTKRRRADDNLEAIKARLDYYKMDVEPVVDYYEKQKRLIRINGERSIEDVYQDIKKVL